MAKANTYPTRVLAQVYGQDAGGNFGKNTVSSFLPTVTPEQFGAVGDGVTDDAPAIQAALNSLSNGVVGTRGGCLRGGPKIYRCNSALVLLNDGGTLPRQPPIIIEGTGHHHSGNSGVSTGGTVFDIRTSDANGHLQTYGIGSLTLLDLQITDGGTSSGNCFVYTTNTTIIATRVAVMGSPALTGATANQDAFVFGGTTSTLGSAANDAFQGYGTIIRECFFDGIRRLAYLRVYANGINISNNHVERRSGNPLLGALSLSSIGSGGTGHAVNDIITLAGGTSSLATTIKVLAVSGGVITSASIMQQGNYTVAPSNAVLQGSTSGSGTGATFNLVYGVNGALIEVDGTGAGGAPGNYVVGTNICNNLVEISGYAYFVTLQWAEYTTLIGNNLYDPTATTLGGINISGNAIGVLPLKGLLDVSKPYVVDNTNGAATTFISTEPGVPSVFPAINVKLLSTFNGGITGVGNAALTWGGAGNFTGNISAAAVNVSAGNQFITVGRSKLFSSADGDWTMWNNGQTGLTSLKLGGSTSSFPEFKVTGPAVAFRRANDSVGVFADLPAASGANEGAIYTITDGSTATWGATVTGGGANHVMIRSNGTNWTVFGA